MQTETEPIPNMIMGDSEWIAGKSKKWDAFLKPKSEPLPNRISETAICVPEMYRVLCTVDHASGCGSSSCRYGLPSRPPRDRYSRCVWSGVGHAGSAGCLHRERPGADHSGNGGRRFAPDVGLPGPGREGDSERRFPGSGSTFSGCPSSLWGQLLYYRSRPTIAVPGWLANGNHAAEQDLHAFLA